MVHGANLRGFWTECKFNVSSNGGTLTISSAIAITNTNTGGAIAITSNNYYSTPVTNKHRIQYFVALADHNLASMKHDPIILANVVHQIAQHFGFSYQVGLITIIIAPYSPAPVIFRIDDLTPEMAAIYEILEL